MKMENNSIIRNNNSESKFELFDLNHKSMCQITYELNYNDNSKFVRILKLHTNPEYRQKGYARLLIQNFIEYFKNLNFERIYIIATPYDIKNDTKKLDLKQLIFFYSRLGFYEAEVEEQSEDTDINLLMIYIYE